MFVQGAPDEIEIDFATLRNETIRELQKFMRSVKSQKPAPRRRRALLTIVCLMKSLLTQLLPHAAQPQKLTQHPTRHALVKLPLLVLQYVFADGSSGASCHEPSRYISPLGICDILICM